MPDRMVWPVSWSVLSRSEGSSPASFCRPSVIFSTLSLVFGSTRDVDDRDREGHALEDDRVA